MSKFNKCVWMFLIGFLLLVIDINIGTGIAYPTQYKTSDKVTGEFQYNNIASNYNASCTYKLIDTTAENQDDATANTLMGQHATKVIDKVILEDIELDLFNDFLGYLLIFIACLGFSKSSSRFRFGVLTSLLGFVLHGVIVALPFVTNGLILTYAAFAVGISYLGAFVLTAYAVSYGIFALSTGAVCRDERRWGKTLSFMIIVGQILITFMYWLGTDHTALRGLAHFFVFVLACFVIGFALVMKRTSYRIKENFIEK